MAVHLELLRLPLDVDGSGEPGVGVPLLLNEQGRGRSPDGAEYLEATAGLGTQALSAWCCVMIAAGGIPRRGRGRVRCKRAGCGPTLPPKAGSRSLRRKHVVRPV